MGLLLMEKDKIFKSCDMHSWIFIIGGHGLNKEEVELQTWAQYGPDSVEVI